MGSVFFTVPMVITPSLRNPRIDVGKVNPHMGAVIELSCNSQLPFPRKCRIRCSRISRILSLSHGQTTGEGNQEEESVDELRVPNHWLYPSKAVEESEWLRVTLHKWLDDEYCPEETNEKISEIASRSFYKSLMGKRTDIGEILLEMARELESISYQESFHGAFSSANAAIDLIIQRIQQD